MAFTAIDGDTSWQDLAIAEELAESYNLRRQVFGLSTVATPTQATEVYAFVRALQEGIEEMMGYDYYERGEYFGWLLNTAALSTYSGQSSFPTPMTLASAMTAAGLTASGYWRRIAEGGTQPAVWVNYGEAGWSYGKVTDKDLAGPWLFKDLQTALAILTRAHIRPTQSRQRSASAVGSSAIPSTAITVGSWSSTLYSSVFNVSKTKTGSSVTGAGATFGNTEYRVDIPDAPAACEAARLVLTMPSDPNNNYAANGSKIDWANLAERDVKAILETTVANTDSKASSGGTTSYSIILGETVSNLVPTANDILPDSAMPSSSNRAAYIAFYILGLIIDFEFE